MHPMPLDSSPGKPVETILRAPLSGKDFDKVTALLRDFQFALDEEIAAVKERPSRDTLEGGDYTAQKDEDEYDYKFTSSNNGLRFAEVIRARAGEQTFTVSYVDAKEDEITLRFPEHLGPKIARIDLEWENDFVLRKMQDQLRLIQSAEREEQFQRIRDLFYPTPPSRVEPAKTEYARQLYEMGDLEIHEDGLRNVSQQEAIRKALYNPVSFVWGPPGTGKTSTLGYIVANYILRGDRVLFVSNTNRAVDVGMLAVMEALHALKSSAEIPNITRFGDIALSSEALDRIHHAKQADARRTRLRQRAQRYQQQLTRYKQLQDELEAIELDGGVPDEELSVQLDTAISEIRRQGGLRRMEELTDTLQQQLQNADFYELISKKAVGTTLAKVCTSDLFFDMEFDAVVVDESSMASLPFLAVMASRSARHLVIAGDPMQLPPIAITTDKKAGALLEQDIFAFASRAEQVSELFDWHDFNPLQTSFFDTQYRLQKDLADIISEVFYEGRLRTGKLSDGSASASVNSPETAPDGLPMHPPGKKLTETVEGTASGGKPVTSRKSRKKAPKSDQTAAARSFRVVDTSFFEPVLTRKNNDYGFSPINEMHQKVLVDTAYQLVTRDLVPMEQIGVIVPFRSTVWDLRRALNKRGLTEIETGTIHTFQGREKRVILFDTVMSGMTERNQLRHFSVRPFDETKNGLRVPRLLNVAFSRAREQLIIFADMRHINRVYNDKFLGRLLNRLLENP
ncbi:MAG: AAA domain [Bacteroidetes bacterium HLUCCA01]|nr:MAG: AAA domain [Bacteroidetes bacterium HLUCCA01]